MFGLWQLPHFWLILLMYPQDYIRSKLPNMLRLFSVDQVRKVLFNWVMVYAVITLTLPLSNAVVTGIAGWLVLLNALGLICNFAYQFFLRTTHYNYKSLLLHLNASLIFMMGLGVLDRLLLFYPRFL
jgi:protoheme IX farnesyltransferase